MSISEKELVVQHNRIVEARYRLSVGEQRIIKLLISMIKKDDVDFKAYQISIKQLSELLGVADNDFYRQVKATTQRLISNVLIFKTIDGNEELQVAWLSSAKYIENKGIVEIEFSPELKPFLLQLKNNITYYKLGNVIHLKNTYSIRIYELLKQYENIGKRRFDIPTLRNTLGIKENEYTRFNDFRRWVLKVSQQELADKTDIVFTWEEEKKAQKCIAITFIISRQNSFQYIEEKGRQLVFEVKPTIEVKTEPPLNEQVERLVAMGVTRSTAEQIAVEYAIDRIERAIAYTKDKQQEGGVKNTAAFVVTAIKKDFNDALAEEKRKKAEAVRLQKQQEKLKKQWQTIKTRYSDWKMQTVEAALLAMPAEVQEGYRQQFKKTPTYEAMLDVFRKNKTIQQRLFLTFMSEHVSLDTLEQWAQKNAVDLSVFSDEIRCE
jgi:plasmid replication initiation protein